MKFSYKYISKVHELGEDYLVRTTWMVHLTIAHSRRNRSQIVLEIGVFKNLAIFIRKHLCRSLFLIKLLVLRHVGKVGTGNEPDSRK